MVNMITLAFFEDAKVWVWKGSEACVIHIGDIAIQVRTFTEVDMLLDAAEEAKLKLAEILAEEKANVR